MEEKINKEALIAKIQKLLNLAEGTSFENEAFSAKEKAGRLMAEYTISMSEVLNTKEGYKEAFIRVDVEGSGSRKVNWEGSLARVIAETFDSKVVNTQVFGNTGREWRIAFVGMKSDLELAIHFFKFLRRSVGQMSEKSFSNLADRMTYTYALVTELGRRLEEIYKIRNQILSSECKDLVVIKTEGVDNFMNKVFPNIQKGKKISLNGSQEAWNRGQSDAKKVSLHRPISGGTAHQRIGGQGA
jgi:hypothetical protein